jgi:hypothetical protein
VWKKVETEVFEGFARFVARKAGCVNPEGKHPSYKCKGYGVKSLPGFVKNPPSPKKVIEAVIKKATAFAGAGLTAVFGRTGFEYLQRTPPKHLPK